MRPRARGEDFGITCCISTRGNDYPRARTYMHTYFEVTSFFLSHTCIYLHPYDFSLCSAKPNRVLFQFNELRSSAVNICVNIPAPLETFAMLGGTFYKRLKLSCSDICVWVKWREIRHAFLNELNFSNVIHGRHNLHISPYSPPYPHFYNPSS